MGEKRSPEEVHAISQASPSPFEHSLPAKKTYLQELNPWSGTHPHIGYFGLLFRPWLLAVYPAVIYSFISFGISLAWLNCILSTSAGVFQKAPYNFTPGLNSLIKLPSIIGVLLGTYCGGSLSDRYCQWKARRNNGVFEPEDRLVMLLFPLFLVPVGLFMFFLLDFLLTYRYGFGIHNKLSWAVPYFGNAFVGFGMSSVPTITFAYCTTPPFSANRSVVDGYAPVAAECLLLSNGLKQFFAFGFNYGVIPWVTKEGYAATFSEMVGIHVGVLLFGIPLWYWGKQIRQVTAKWKVIWW
jgi:hypothetical protein